MRSHGLMQVWLFIHCCTDMCKHCLPRITSLTMNESACGRRLTRLEILLKAPAKRNSPVMTLDVKTKKLRLAMTHLH